MRRGRPAFSPDGSSVDDRSHLSTRAPGRPTNARWLPRPPPTPSHHPPPATQVTTPFPTPSWAAPSHTTPPTPSTARRAVHRRRQGRLSAALPVLPCLLPCLLSALLGYCVPAGARFTLVCCFPLLRRRGSSPRRFAPASPPSTGARTTGCASRPAASRTPPSGPTAPTARWTARSMCARRAPGRATPAQRAPVGRAR